MAGQVAFDRDTVFLQERGCCQGDPCGPIYYACGLEFMKLQHRGVTLNLSAAEAVRTYTGVHGHAVEHRVWEHPKFPHIPDSLRGEVDTLLRDLPATDRKKLDSEVCAPDYLDDLTRIGDPETLCALFQTLDRVFAH